MNNIFSLNKFRKNKKNYYNAQNECKLHTKNWGKPTNPRFKLFDQKYFTAGDFKDINKYALLPLRYYYSTPLYKPISNKLNETTIFKLYKNIDYQSTFNTFQYMFYKFKKGIFVIIRDNKLVLYMPFSNAFYKNNWVKQTYFSLDEKKLLENNDYDKIKNILNKNIIDFQNKYPDQFKGRKIDFNRESWYANNCVFRNQYPKYEGELNTNIFKNMLDSLLKERTIPDIEFFINDRDFPILKKDFTEPYDHLFDSESIKIEKEYCFDKMTPIFSKSITNNFADILIPTNDEWLMVSNKYFTDDCSNSYTKKQTHKWNYIWKNKKAICIFRGGATGCGTTIENNMRLKAADIAVDYPDILDIGINDWKARPRKVKREPIHIINPSKFRFNLKQSINNIEKSNYKFILHIDGYVSAFRLASELSMNSCVLIVKSDYKMWFSHLLIEYEHYVPIKNDLSDLVSQVEWCIKNDKKCEKIANNSRKLYDKYLTKDGIYDYLENQFKLIYSNKNFNNLLNIQPKIKTKMKNIALISIFRDNQNGERKRELNIFIKLMNTLLSPYCKFHIYIIEQSEDGEFFNIGKLKNIGFIEANKDNKDNKTDKYDNYIFSDIDTIPDYNLIEYYFKKLKYPISLALRGTRYMNDSQVNKKIFLGALLGFNKTQFEKINGYPNNFWGWGGEDEAIKNRLLNSNINIFYYPKTGSIIDMEETKEMKTINNVNNKLKIVNKEEIKIEKLYNDLSTWKDNGLSNLQYNILSSTKLNENTTLIKVDLMKKDDNVKYPHLYNIQQTDNYKKLQQIITNKIKNLKYEFI
jgi:hypothetical protein